MHWFPTRMQVVTLPPFVSRIPHRAPAHPSLVLPHCELLSEHALTLFACLPRKVFWTSDQSGHMASSTLIHLLGASFCDWKGCKGMQKVEVKVYPCRVCACLCMCLSTCMTRCSHWDFTLVTKEATVTIYITLTVLISNTGKLEKYQPSACIQMLVFYFFAKFVLPRSWCGTLNLCRNGSWSS